MAFWFSPSWKYSHAVSTMMSGPPARLFARLAAPPDMVPPSADEHMPNKHDFCQNTPAGAVRVPRPACRLNLQPLPGYLQATPRSDRWPPGDQDRRTCCQSAAPGCTAGRSHQVAGLDCAGEVAIRNRAVGPAGGGNRRPAFEVVNGRMTVPDSAGPVPIDRFIRAVARTGMTARPWDGATARADRAAHVRRRARFTAASGGFRAGGPPWHPARGGTPAPFAGHGGTPMPVPGARAALFGLATLSGARLVAPGACPPRAGWPPA